MVTATILIAAAGYISNDYFDTITDRINKPEKLYIGKQITRGFALSSALLLSLAATILALWLSWSANSWLPGLILVTALLVAWWYAIRLKKSLLLGNIAVACMSAGTIAMAWLIEGLFSGIPEAPSMLITIIVVAISSFAFLLSFIREIVKDIEDIEGDKLIDCQSLPIVKGILITKKVLYLFTSITFLLLIISQLYLFHFSKYIALAWLFACVEVPLVVFIRKLIRSESKADFHRLSSLLKMIMLGGILTMVAGQF